MRGIIKKNNRQVKKSFRWKKTRYAALQVGIRALLGVLICAAAISTIYIGRKPYGEELKEGDISLRTIYTPIDFKYRTGVDKEKTELEREKAAEAIDEVYDIDPQIAQTTLGQIDKFFSRIAAAQNLKETEEEQRLQELQDTVELRVSEAHLKSFLADDDAQDTGRKTAALLKGLFARGIASDNLRSKLTKSGRKYIALRKLGTEDEDKVPVEDLLTLKQTKEEIADEAQRLFPETRKLRLALINLTQAIVKTNLKANKETTKQRRRLAYKNAPLQYLEKQVKKEELIVARGERVIKGHLLKIKEMIHRQVKVNRFMFFSGATILTLIFLMIISIYLKLYEPKVFFSARKLILIGALFILILGLAKFITYSPLPSYAIPVAIASILIAMLIGPHPAIIITVALSIFVGIIAGDKLNVACVSFVGGIVGIFSIRGARRRSQILITGCLVGMANFASICAIELLHGLEYTVFLKEGFWGIINGLGSAIIITGILPVFEYLFNMVTNISLLELSDLNHPLLREMVLKAPGTYHHSLIVGNLAEAATEAIGRNTLLARVG